MVIGERSSVHTVERERKSFPTHKEYAIKLILFSFDLFQVHVEIGDLSFSFFLFIRWLLSSVNSNDIRFVHM